MGRCVTMSYLVVEPAGPLSMRSVKLVDRISLRVSHSFSMEVVLHTRSLTEWWGARFFRRCWWLHCLIRVDQCISNYNRLKALRTVCFLVLRQVEGQLRLDHAVRPPVDSHVLNYTFQVPLMIRSLQRVELSNRVLLCFALKHAVSSVFVSQR